jgi:CheY-like chemotaxis protein
MDIHMPVMDGLEAATKILELNAGVPIVAMTANIMANDRDLYKKSGMTDCVGKPFTSQVLWRCLLKYFKPLDDSFRDDEQDERINRQKRGDKLLQQKLINSFVKINQDIYNEITNALNVGDIELAYRLVHTLKSNAGHLNKINLQKIAQEAENCLKDAKKLSPELMESLKAELDIVLSELKPLVSEPDSTPISESLGDVQIQELLKNLKALLNEGNSECLTFIDKLRSIPGTGELIQQIEAFDFDLAIETLQTLFGSILNEEV